MFRKILLASDGSDDALRAAQAAAEIARRFDAPLTVLYVYATPLYLGPGIDAPAHYVDPAKADQAIQDAKEAVTGRTRVALEKAGVVPEMRYEFGHPAEVIVRVADTERFDLVVLGSRGLNAVASFLLGSVSDRIAHHAHCPVLIVR